MYLANLGKTNNSDPEERLLLPRSLKAYMNPHQMPQKIFLYEISQLSDGN
jgi:hypothetical protein